MGRAMWRQALLLAGKDVRILLADKAAIMFMIVFPLILVAGLSNVMGPAYVNPDTQMQVVLATREGPGTVSHAIIDGLRSSGGTIAIDEVDADGAHQAVLDGKLGGYIEFPAGFTADLQAGKPAILRVFVHPSAQAADPALDSVAQSIAGAITGQWVEAQATAALVARLGGPEVSDRLALLLQGQSPPVGGVSAPPAASGSLAGTVDLEVVRVGPAASKSVATYMFPGYVTMFVFFGLALTAEALVGERENHTLDRLIASQATRGSILLGKYLGNVARGTLQAIVLLGVAHFVFDLDLGYHPWAMLVVTLAIVLCASALGLAMATMARTKRAASGLAVLGSMIMAPLGGCWWPVYIMPPWMQALAKVTPHAWANAAYAKLLQFAAAPAAIAGEVAALLGFAAAFGAYAAVRFRIED